MNQALGPGDQIGPYRLEAELGHGGMGQVFRARDSRLGRVVAIKVIRPDLASDDGFRRRFEREGRMIATLNHPHVCVLYDILEHAGSACLVMEYVEGETLARVLARGALSINEVRTIAAAMASALAAAHAHGIVHRDLKPGNIMVTPFGVKVLDFGLAKEEAGLNACAETTLAPDGLTTPGQIVGTPAYMSPEQVASRPVDARSDIFAAGVILYEMLSGAHPFSGATSVETMAAILQATPGPLSGRGRAIPHDLVNVVNRCMQKSPEDRFASGSELLQSLTAGRPSQPGAATAWRLTAAFAVLLVAGAAYFGWSRYQRASRAAWVDKVAVPEIARLIEADLGLAALALYRKADEYAPASHSLLKVSEGVATRPIQLDTSPSGATLYISDYTAALGDDLSQWKRLGTTPLTLTDVPGWGYYRLRAVKPGHAKTDAVLGGQNALSNRDAARGSGARWHGVDPPHGAVSGTRAARILAEPLRSDQRAVQAIHRRRRLSQARVLEGAGRQGRPHAVVGGNRRRVPGQDRSAGAVDMGTERFPGWSGEVPRQRRELVRGGSVRGVRGREPPDASRVESGRRHLGECQHPLPQQFQREGTGARGIAARHVALRQL